MDALVSGNSGDDTVQETTQVTGVLANKTLASRAATASPSGDFADTSSHKCVALIASESSAIVSDAPERHIDVFEQNCEFGDSWANKFQLPLSKCTQRTIRTGNNFYDAIIPDLQLIGYKALQIIAKGKSGALVLAQNLHKVQNLDESETIPVALKLNSGKSRRTGNRPGAKVEMHEEMEIHRKLAHSNIVRWLSNLEYEGRLATVMEYCENGTLEDLLKLQTARFLPETVARRYFWQMHAAVEYLHGEGVAHRDICPQNLLIDRNNVLKLCDFRFAVNVYPGYNLKEECGSLGYQAPEVLSGSPYNPSLVDIWAMGATLYVMCTSRPPLGTIRYSLNRIAHSAWFTKADNSLRIGNFYRIRQPCKMSEGALERDVKENLKI
ncbi:SMKZ-like protein [Mya arenaria]|uniref:SMKZ-like protein n=1 Tax=Mya arenaria TaxID=6604 RepID=A0ABY7G314_MYAAR|nr:SMKZ-like protein [Mya arenaria]